MKNCSRCEQDKEEKDFNRRGKKFSVWCRTCCSEYNRERYKNSNGKVRKKLKQQEAARKLEIEKKIVDHLKNNPCVKCQESNILVLDFDHIRGEKEFNIAKAIWDVYSWERIEKEIAKCQVLCANCHRIKTAKQLNTWKLKYIP
jgi:hypothetical protein